MLQNNLIDFDSESDSILSESEFNISSKNDNLMNKNKNYNLELHPIEIFKQLKEKLGQKIIIGYEEPCYRSIVIAIGDFINVFPEWEKDLIWCKQRPINENKVKEISFFLKEKKKRSNVLINNQVITIGTILGKEPKILDGQHRLKALSQLDFHNKFFLNIMDFISNEERFLEYIAMNNNTPLPDYYKSISDIDSFWTKISDQISEIMIERYEFLKEEKGYYKFTESFIKEKIFESLKIHNVKMQDIEPIIQQFLQLLENKVIFPNTSSLNYDPVIYDINKCRSQKSRNNSKEQCCNKIKKYNGKNGYCRTHYGSKTPDFDEYEIRNQKFNLLKSKYEKGFFILDKDWTKKIMNLIYPIPKDLI